MIDELDLAFDEGVDKTRPRHRRKRGGGKGGKSGVAFLMAREANEKLGIVRELSGAR